MASSEVILDRLVKDCKEFMSTDTAEPKSSDLFSISTTGVAQTAFDAVTDDDLYEINGFHLWYSDIRDILSDDQLSYFISKLLPDEVTKVTAFKFIDDQKRSILSILLQRALVRYHAKVTDAEYHIERTRENKPYPIFQDKSIGLWNYNVSHHKNYVLIGSHKNFLVGVDVVDILYRSNVFKAPQEFFDMFSRQYNDLELLEITKEKDEVTQYIRFFVNWALKESFVKAVGLGLQYDLKDIRFEIKYSKLTLLENGCAQLSGTSVVFVKGCRRDDWRFDFMSLDNDHVMAIARGPLNEVSDSYRRDAWKMEHMGDSHEATSSTSDIDTALPPIHYYSPKTLLDMK